MNVAIMDETKSNQLAEFTALAHLLSLRNNGAIDSTCVDEFDSISCVSDDDAEGSVCTTRPQLISSFRDGSILRRLLNRLSELLAVERNGRFVSAAVLRENEKEEYVDIWVARNSSFGPDDRFLLTTLGKGMTSIAKRAEDSESAAHDLWKRMILYSKPRITAYRRDITRLLQCNKRAIHDAISEHRGAAPEIADILQEILSEVTGRVSGSNRGSEEERLKRLVCAAFKVRKRATAKEELESLLPDKAIAGNIHSELCFLGRVRAAYETFTMVCLEKWTGFEVRIHSVELPRPIKLHKCRLNLSETLSLIGLPLNDSTLKKYIKKKGYKRGEAVQDFDKLREQKTYVHAEIQLIFHLQKQNLRDCFPYIGTSKLNCFLCAEFLSTFGDFGTRGSHGRPYSKWLIPSTAGLRPDCEEAVWSSIQKVEERMRRQLLSPLEKGRNFKAESTIGLTVASHCSSSGQPDYLDNPLVQMFLRNRESQIQQQQMMDFFNPRQTEEPDDQPSADIVSEVGSESTASQGDQEYECDGGCFRFTSRRCGKCGKGYFCSTSCETNMGPHHAFNCSLGRPLSTADYLMLDIAAYEIPEDSDVLADFGLASLSREDRSNLMGLYKGLDRLGVSAEKLHEWQSSGTVVEHVIETFSHVPESSRGWYFPWFMENHHRIFGQDQNKSRQSMSSESQIQQCYDKVRMHLEPEDQQKSIDELEPVCKRKAFIFFSLIAQHSHPPPMFHGPYIDFGFCICTGELGEDALGGLYHRLLFGDTIRVSGMSEWAATAAPSRPPLCTFSEFWQAFHGRGLIELMDSRGLKSEREAFPHLDSVLSRSCSEALPSVWMLRTFLNDERETVAPKSTLFQYGFIGCANHFDIVELKEFYQEVLVHADPLDLEKASVEHRLLEFGKCCTSVNKKIVEILGRSPILG